MTPLPYGLQELKVSLGVAGWKFTRGDWPAFKIVLEASTDNDATVIMVQPSYFGNQVTIKVHGGKFDVSTVIEADRVMHNIARISRSLVAGWLAADDRWTADELQRERNR